MINEYLNELLHVQAESNEPYMQDMLAQIAIDEIKKHRTDVKVEHDIDIGYQITVGEGDFYPCLIAHLDQVHKYKDDFHVWWMNNVITATSDGHLTGVGGDDKCGIYVASMVAIVQPATKICFFYDEEVGCAGSSLIFKDHFFDDVSLLIGIDRHGNSDLITQTNGHTITSKVLLKTLKPIMEVHGYKKATGTFSDVGEVSQTTNIAGMNVSCGFYGEHTDHEYINFTDLENTVSFIHDIIDATNYKRWGKPKNKAPVYKPYIYGSYKSHSKYKTSQYCIDCSSVLDIDGNCPYCDSYTYAAV